jgi:hypothetical protein
MNNLSATVVRLADSSIRTTGAMTDSSLLLSVALCVLCASVLGLRFNGKLKPRAQ